MANQFIPFNKSSYYLAHPKINEVLIKNILLPELERQGVLGKSTKGIELPVGTSQAPEYISLAEAKELILEYFITTLNLPERDQKVLGSAANYVEFCNLATSFVNHEIIEPETMGALITPDKLITLQKSKASATINDQSLFSSDQTIREYNELYFKILKMGNTGNSAQILARLFPGGITAATDITQLAFAQVIVSNLTRLNQATSLGTTIETKNYAVAQEFSKILNNYPALAGYRNYLGNDAIQTYLAQYISSIATQATVDTPNILDKFSDMQRQYGKKLKQYLPNESELREQIYRNLPPMSDKDRRTLTDQILRASTKNSLNSVGIDEIIRELRLNQDAQNKISQALRDTGLNVSLEYHQGKIRFLVNFHSLTSAELKLLKRGINPFLTTQNPSDKVLVDKEYEILTLYNEKSINAGHPFTTLKEAYAHENIQENPDLLFLEKSRDLLNRQNYYASLSPQELAHVRSTHFGRWLTNTTSRMNDLQEKMTDAVFDLTDTVTGKKWLHKQFENWERFSSKITIPGTNIPLFRINDWILNQFETWKKAKTLKLISISSNWKSPLGKFTHARLKDYQLGDFTIKGMVSVGLFRTWSNFAYKASNKIIKGGLILSTRTLKRLLITVGGRALAKIGLRAITTLSGIFTVIGIVLIAKDILDLLGAGVKWGWTQIKKIVPTTEGAIATVITGITGFVALGWAGAISAIMTLLGPIVIPGIISIITLLSITYGSIYFFTMQEHGFDMSIHLDPGTGVTPNTARFEDIKCTPGSPPVSLAAAGSGIPQKSFEIVNNLYQGFWCYWNRPANPEKSQQYITAFKEVDKIKYPGSKYPEFLDSHYFNYEQFFANPNPPEGGQDLFWCTQLVEKAYELAGNSYIPHNLNAQGMQDEWDQSKFIPAALASSLNVKPGATVFFHVIDGPDRTNHVGVVNTVSSIGITLYQSNAGSRIGSIPFVAGGIGLGSIMSGIITVGIGNP